MRRAHPPGAARIPEVLLRLDQVTITNTMTATDVVRGVSFSLTTGG